MMVDVVFNRLKELGKVSAFSNSDKRFIEEMYMEVLGKKFVKTSCNDCYHDAVFEMYAYLKKNGKMKEKSIYQLKNGVLLQMGFGSGEFYTNANLTDEAAERFLSMKPEKINLFAIYPDDWTSRVEKRFRPAKQKESVKVEDESGSKGEKKEETKKES